MNDAVAAYLAAWVNPNSPDGYVLQTVLPYLIVAGCCRIVIYAIDAATGRA